MTLRVGREHLKLMTFHNQAKFIFNIMLFTIPKINGFMFQHCCSTVHYVNSMLFPFMPSYIMYWKFIYNVYSYNYIGGG